MHRCASVPPGHGPPAAPRPDGSRSSIAAAVLAGLDRGTAARLRCLAARYGADDFWPADPARRGPLGTWAEWAKNTFAEAVLEVFVYDVRMDPATRDPAILQAATDRLIPLAGMLEARIGQGPWLDGESFTFADIAAGHILHRVYTLDWPRPRLPNLAGYYARLQERPAYRDNAMVSYGALRGSY